jgi:hypothetical protein
MATPNRKTVYDIPKPSALCSGRYRDEHGVSCAVEHLVKSIAHQVGFNRTRFETRSVLNKFLGMSVEETGRLETINDNGNDSDHRIALLGKFCTLHPKLNWVK